MAQGAGVKTGTVSLIGRGRSNPAWGTVKAIAGALGVSVSELAKSAETMKD